MHDGLVYPYDGLVYPYDGMVYPYDGLVYPYDGVVSPYHVARSPFDVLMPHHIVYRTTPTNPSVEVAGNLKTGVRLARSRSP